MASRDDEHNIWPPSECTAADISSSDRDREDWDSQRRKKGKVQARHTLNAILSKKWVLPRMSSVS